MRLPRLLSTAYAAPDPDHLLLSRSYLLATRLLIKLTNNNSAGRPPIAPDNSRPPRETPSPRWTGTPIRASNPRTASSNT
ncbi:hypothetical protein ACWDBF_08150 [Streptomyces angustmyceticus]